MFQIGMNLRYRTVNFMGKSINWLQYDEYLKKKYFVINANLIQLLFVVPNSGLIWVFKVNSIQLKGRVCEDKCMIWQKSDLLHFCNYVLFNWFDLNKWKFNWGEWMHFVSPYLIFIVCVLWCIYEWCVVSIQDFKCTAG